VRLKRNPSAPADLAIPVVMATICVVAFALLLQRTDQIYNWSTSHGARGTFVVTSCELSEPFGADFFQCQGLLFADGASAEVNSTLISSGGGDISAWQPYVGEKIDDLVARMVHNPPIRQERRGHGGNDAMASTALLAVAWHSMDCGCCRSDNSQFCCDYFVSRFAGNFVAQFCEPNRC